MVPCPPIFCRYDTNKDGYLCRNELKRMLIKRRVPWTENSLNQLIDDVDKDKDGKLTFREVYFNIILWINYLIKIFKILILTTNINFFFQFLMTNRKTLEYCQRSLAKQDKVDFNKVGIKGVRDFFEAKV